LAPIWAASILGLELGYSAVFLMCSGAALMAMLIYAFLFLRFKQRMPSLAYAT
jgi:hypothetical protein